MSAIEHKFQSRNELIDSLYRLFVDELAQALQDEAPATLLLSGGSTPAPLYRRLSSAELAWDRIHVALVDERWVDTSSEASNERLLRQTLLVDNAAAAPFVGMKNSQPSASAGVDACNIDYADLPAPYSICLLGMGPDGHTASLFPGAEGLAAAIESERHCAAVRATKSEVTGSHVERMTMTPWSILQSRRLILLITGEDKWEVYRNACRSGASPELPISLFIHQQNVPLEVYWAP